MILKMHLALVLSLLLSYCSGLLTAYSYGEFKRVKTAQELRALQVVEQVCDNCEHPLYAHHPACYYTQFK